MNSILIITEQFMMGGLETHIRGEIIYLHSQGFQVHLAVGEQFSDVLVPPGLDSLTTGIVLGPAASAGQMMEAVHCIRGIIRQNAVDLVHVHPFSSLLPGIIAAQAEGVPAVITLHGPASLDEYGGPLYECITKYILLPAASAVICVSDEVRNMVVPYVQNSRIKVLPNGVRFPDRVGASVLMDPRWCVVSRLDAMKIKGIRDFIVKAKVVNIPGVLIVGDGPARDILQKQLAQDGLADYVEFYGYCADVQPLMTRHAGIAGMGRVLLEGIAAHRPVVLVGYDGVKGLVTLELFESARLTNFSGRGLDTVSAAVLGSQLIALASDDEQALYTNARLQFEENIIWSRLRERLVFLEPVRSNILGAMYAELEVTSAEIDVPLLESVAVLKMLLNFSCDPQCYSPQLIAELKLCANKLSHSASDEDLVRCEIKEADMNNGIKKEECIVMAINEFAVEIADLQEQLTNARRVLDEREIQLDNIEITLRDRDEEIADLARGLADREALLQLADAYRIDKETYIAQLLQDIEMRKIGFSGGGWKVDQILRRISHYINRSRHLIAAGGVLALYRALASKIRRARHSHVESNAAGLYSSNREKFVMPSEIQFGPLLRDELVIITGVPFDDIGGGQRGAQLARCALKTGRRVIYVYVYPKYDFETGSHVESDVHILGLMHLPIDKICPAELLGQISEQATIIVELPHPKILPFLDACNARGLRTVFELIDDWETSLGGEWFSMDIYRQFVERSQAVVGTAKILVQRLLDLGRKDALYLPNASNEYIFDKYKSFERPSDLPKRGRKIALYFGSLYGEWFAWDFVTAAATENPRLDVVLIGDNPGRTGLPSNVYFLGAKKIDELPGYLAHSDMALIPFVPGKISDAVSPIKVFEYLFIGKPVIATRLPEIVDYPGVYVADSPEDYARLCGQSFERDALVTENDKFISKNSWFSRLDQLIGRDVGKEFASSISVIILIHNNREIIGRCLESLLLHGMDYIREVIVVDNASADGGAEFVRDNFPEVRVVVNEVNGCSSGRNLGASLASGRYLAFFDSDQWFTSSSCFLEALRILSRDASVGVIGWGAGWFDSTRSDLGGMIADYCPNRGMNPEAIVKGYRADIGYLGTCGFFVPKSVFEATGGFDVFYDPTCFEDTDLSFQIKRLGLQVCFRDLSGIRHQPHQTTKASSQSNGYTKLFLRNAEYFKEKWKSHPEFFIDYPGY